jgi:tRNA-2-methylthio-N6-dimethylallyladenosine synthase
MNESDSERIAGFLELLGLKPAMDSKKADSSAKALTKADLVIFNTCGVRQMAEDRVYGQIHNIREQESVNSEQKRRIIILTGCLADRKDVQGRLENKVDMFIPIKDIFKIKNLKLIKNSKLKIKNSVTCDNNYLKILPQYKNSTTAYIPIMTGCNNFCSYCIVPYARGREISRPAEEIIHEIKSLVKKGYKEIILLGQNVNSYLYKNIKFPALLDKIAKNNPGMNFRFLTSHPKDFSQNLIDVIEKNKNISREIHLPVQAGSDKILKAMNRPYTQKKYLSLIDKIKKNIPEATFTTDIIVGFPGETKNDFEESIKVFKKVKYNEAYINKYSPRPGTAAWKLKETVTLPEKKRREKILRALVGYGKN